MKEKCPYCGSSDFRYYKEFVGNIPQNEHISWLVWICNDCNKSQLEKLVGKYDKTKKLISFF